MNHNLLIALPLLRITSSAHAEAFYCGRLGFTLESANRPSPPARDPVFLCVVRDAVRLHLSSHTGDGVFGSAVGIWVQDVDSLHAEFFSRGVAIALPPTDQTWGNREMYIRDPDANTIRFMQACR
jgi:catechol 2,3-dioxygenase-like lactoylglutathione lyase family enzyme